jgi:glycosyltransferase involved in cell wall biosynthesis
MTPSSEPFGPNSEKRALLKSICFVVSSPLIVKFFLIEQIVALSRIYHIECVTNCGDDPAWLPERGIVVPLLNLRIERAPSPIHDVRAFWTLLRYLKRNRFDVVHSFSPKAGLLAMTAAALTGIPVRIHTFTGQVWATRSGLTRFILKMLDTWTAAMATHILVDSESQRTFLLDEGVLRAGKSRVLGHGSISGVDLARFRPNSDVRAAIRIDHNVPSSAIVFLYLGRWKRDKGVLDLARAFSQLSQEHGESYLFFVGPDEDRLETQIRGVCGQCISRVRFVSYTDNPESWLAACDVLCLPSYREGFGSTIIEAGSVGLPSLGSRIYGITDAIVEGVTGLLHNPADSSELMGKMRILALDGELRRSLGAAARERSHRFFAKEALTAALLEFYAQALGADAVSVKT